MKKAFLSPSAAARVDRASAWLCERSPCEQILIVTANREAASEIVRRTVLESKGGAAFHGFSTTGKNDQAGDPQVDSLIEKARIEPDIEKRKGLIFDLQRYLAKAVYGLASPGGATGFQVAWPAVGNYLVWRGARNHFRLWVDDTKPPFRSS